MPRQLLAILALVAFAPCLQAQTLEEVRPGTRIRLTTRDAPAQVVGSLDGAASADTVYLRDSTGTSLAIARNNIGRIEISRGRHGRSGKGALYGFLLGAGAAVALATSCDCNQVAFGLVSGIVFGSAGAGFGALVGGLGTSEVWQRLPAGPESTRPFVPPAIPTGRSSP